MGARANKRAFLSYARDDLEQARRLYDALLRAGVAVWFDQTDLISGVEWRPAIRKAIRESAYFLAVLSKHAVTGKGFRHTELREALEVWREFPRGQVFLIPVRLDNCRMPVPELEELSFADLFPDWEAGIAKLTSALGGRKSRSSAPPEVARPSVLDYEYRIALADLDVGLTNLAEVARTFNELQRFFHFTITYLRAAPAAARVIEHSPQLLVDRLQRSFYEERAHVAADYILCLTRRFIAFEEGRNLNYNYLGYQYPTDERFGFISLAGLYAHAKDAGVKFEVALAYVIATDVAAYFGGVYHSEIRGCPMDLTENHADLVVGLKRGRFCAECRKKLSVNRRSFESVLAMVRWGRSS
jgi:hypothetical protein